MVGSVNPYELFLIFNELVGAAQSSDVLTRSTAENLAYMIDQSHNIEGKLLPMLVSVINCQEAYAKALIVNRAKLRVAQQDGDVLGAHEILNAAYKTDVRPLLAHIRQEMDVPSDPIAAYRASGYEAKIANERGTAKNTGGYQS